MTVFPIAFKALILFLRADGVITDELFLNTCGLIHVIINVSGA